MFQNRPVLFMGLAVGIALVTTILIYNWLQQQKQSPQVVEERTVTIEGTPIAVASADLAWGTPIKKEMIREIPFPQENLPSGHFKKPEDLIGRIVLTSMKRHEPILESKLAPIDIKSGGVLGVLDPEKRAMAVKVDQVVALPGFLKPGDRVDIMLTMAGEKGQKKITKTVLENMKVLAIGTQMERGPADGKPQPVKIVTFEVTLEEAEMLAMASNGGQLRFALRSPLNPDLKKTRGATIRDLQASFKLYPPPKKKAKQRHTRVEVIKGNAKSVVKF
ncbi:MAG: Flp pilus assembly protein CpaB [Nitrospirales bacterium]|nr:Flp pilus assembly protein CpaB [Nitrospira sp.]MDR4501782.1 Flp pilus assembly protein CpaB [Nitrospirales bacterium]